MKKRTSIPGYGKYHQRAEATGAAAMKQDNRDMANYEFAKLRKPNPMAGKRNMSGKSLRGH